MMDFLVDFARPWLYGALAAAWLINALIMVVYYANVLRHRVVIARFVTYANISISYVLLSLITGLSPVLDSESVLPWVVLCRVFQFVGAVGIGWESWQRLKE